VIAEECTAAAAMGTPIVIVMLLVFFVLGFLLGTRGRQIAASAKNIGAALRTFISLRIPSVEASILGQKTAADDGGEDEQDMDNQELDDAEINLDEYVQPVDGDATLADHPDVQMSPVILYQIKRSKDEIRKQQRRMQLAADGLTDSEINERMDFEAMTGGGGSGQRQNPLALLIAHGANVTPAQGGKDADNAALQDRRRLQRNVDGFLSKTKGVEKLRKDLENKITRDPTGGRLKTASEVAMSTANVRFGGLLFQRELANLQVAKGVRTVYREWEKQRQKERASSVPERQEGGLGLLRERAGAGGPLDADALAAIQAEFDEDGEMGEGEEGEEGGDEDGDEEWDV